MFSLSKKKTSKKNSKRNEEKYSLVDIIFSLHSVPVEASGARWRSGRASGSESRAPGFDPHSRHRIWSLNKTH